MAISLLLLPLLQLTEPPHSHAAYMLLYLAPPTFALLAMEPNALCMLCLFSAVTAVRQLEQAAALHAA
jgi:hypothetical protein